MSNFFSLKNPSILTSIVPDVPIEGDDEDDHVVHGPADAEGLGVLVQAVATYIYIIQAQYHRSLITAT